MAADYSNTLNLPKTDFPMRGNLPSREPETLDFWKDISLYEKMLEKNSGLPEFVLHDGPPYANGDVHMGHTLNKILKDIVVKHKSMTGFYSPYVPGWDTHGLPIEQQAIAKMKLEKEKLSAVDFRALCREFALKYVENQKQQFIRLGVVGDFDNPYLTLNFEFEAAQLRVFADMVGAGLIYRDFKPVHFCTSCETALAEAEVEYKDQQCKSIYVKFEVCDDKGKFGLSHVYFIIWTTTAWTLPGNLAICVSPDDDYVIVSANGENYVVAEKLADSVMKSGGVEDYKILKTFRGTELENIVCRHPFIDRESKVISGSHVTMDSGTGCVHTAPGFGFEDYAVCRRHSDIGMVVHVDHKGLMNEEAGEFHGLHYKKAGDPIIQRLQSDGMLFASEDMSHSYPHCWRCGNGIIFRATKQWFASIEKIRDDVLAEIKGVKWIPSWGEERMAAMIKDRADWCISRQRLWGVPIPVLYCRDCGEPLLDKDVILHISDIFRQKGSDEWFRLDSAEFLPQNRSCGCGCAEFDKETDTMDVWFDSGTTHTGVVRLRSGLRFPADLYLEGNDQYRGWFQSSLITSVAAYGKAPYEKVLTHGFVVDGDGRKMSKSLGNGVSPQKIINEHGADILRLWVASSDYKSEIKYSPDILKQLSEGYRKIRNTARYILGNTSDFNPCTDSVKIELLSGIDRFMLIKYNRLLEKVYAAYENHDYHIVYHAVHSFCVVDMSNFYLDIIKDRLYTEKSDSLLRRSSQTVMYEILLGIVKVLAPILSFTCEEIWRYIKNSKVCCGEPAKPQSVFLETFPVADKSVFDDTLEEKWNKIYRLRDEVYKELEKARADKIIGTGLEAKVILRCSDPSEYDFVKSILDQLCQVFIVSGAVLEKDDSSQQLPRISVEMADGEKCPRCWNFSELQGFNDDKVCSRCAEVLRDL